MLNYEYFLHETQNVLLPHRSTANSHCLELGAEGGDQ